MFYRLAVLSCCLLLVAVQPALADPPSPTTQPAVKPAKPAKPSVLQTIWSHTKLSTKWYVGYSHGEAKQERFNKFSIGRGYVTLKLKPVKWFQPRVTLDAHQDAEGDFEVRLKYLHGKFILPMETAVITEPWLELGMVHTPWFDYEEHINNYRMEGTMFTERNGVMNSADLGGTVGALLGRKLPKSYRKQVSKKYPGTWGSFALGLYNGGGYHAKETNNDKVFQARVSLRPAGPWLPNLQLSGFVVHGKGNTIHTPNWRLYDLMLSFEHQFFVLAGHFATGSGNQKGSKVTKGKPAEALDFIGGSGFAEIKAPCLRSSIIARLDYWDWDTDGGASAETRLIAGYVFHFLPHNFALLSLDRVAFTDGDRAADWQVKLTVQLKFPL